MKPIRFGVPALRVIVLIKGRAYRVTARFEMEFLPLVRPRAERGAYSKHAIRFRGRAFSSGTARRQRPGYKPRPVDTLKKHSLCYRTLESWGAVSAHEPERKAMET